MSSAVFPSARACGQDLVLALGIDLGVVGQMPDVGDVLADDDRQAVPLGVAPDQVGQQERPQVADVREPVHRRPAGVHPQLAGRLAGWLR